MKENRVKSVNYPGLDSSSYQELATKQMKLSDGMIRLELVSLGDETCFLESPSIFVIVESPG